MRYTCKHPRWALSKIRDMCSPPYTALIFVLCSALLWRRQWHPTPVLLPGKSHGRGSLMGCSPWDCWGSDTTERLRFLFTFVHWTGRWQPTPVFLPGESRGRGSLAGCCLWCGMELDMTEVTQQQQQRQLYCYIFIVALFTTAKV